MIIMMLCRRHHHYDHHDEISQDIVELVTATREKICMLLSTSYSDQRAHGISAAKGTAAGTRPRSSSSPS